MTEKNGEKRPYKRNEKGRFVKGTAPGPGRKNRDFLTDFELACREVAEALRLGKEPDRVQIEFLKTGIKAGLKEKFPFWKEILERIYGKVPEKIKTDLTVREIEQKVLTPEDKKRATEIDQLLKNYVRKKQRFSSLDINKGNQKRKE